MSQQSILDARLAEIDRRLRNIQSGLAPAVGAPPAPPASSEAAPRPAPTAPEPPGAPQTRGDPQTPERLVAQLREIAAVHERLLISARELVAAFADALARAQPQPGPSGTSVSISAGPFSGIEALRRFEHSLSTLPSVAEVTVREYAGEDRAVVDVLLLEPTS